MSSRKSRFLRMEHARVPELECQLESAWRESQDRAAEVTEARAAELLTAERATASERGLEAVKVRLVETKAMLQESLAKTEVVLQSTLETLEVEQKDLELEWKALESEQMARSEADLEVLAF